MIKFGRPKGTQDLAEEIARMSSLVAGDVHNCIRCLLTVMRSRLLNSQSVRLDGLGTFTVLAHCKGNGVDSEEEVNYKQINKLTIHFSPERRFKQGGGVTYEFFEGVRFEPLRESKGGR